MSEALTQEITKLNIKLNDMLAKLRKRPNNTRHNALVQQPIQQPQPQLQQMQPMQTNGRVKRMVRNIETKIQAQR